MSFFNRFNKDHIPLDQELERSFKDFLLADKSLINETIENQKILLENLLTVSYEVRRLIDDGGRHSGLSYRGALNLYRESLQAGPQKYGEEDYYEIDRIAVRQEKVDASQQLDLILDNFSNAYKTKGTTFDIDSNNSQINAQRVSEAVVNSLHDSLRNLITRR